jgi:hypothetical protein
VKATVFGLSAAVLLHEICLLRVLSIAYWHHAAALVVSVALLGFGAAGTLLALAPRLRAPSVVPLCAIAYSLLVAPSLLAARAIDFNILEVGWEPLQWLRLLALEAIFLVPFLVAGLGINVALALSAERPGPTYAANLLGSGTGSLAAPLLLTLGPPAEVLRYAAVLAALSGITAAPRTLRLLHASVAAMLVFVAWPDLPMSPFKDFASFPDKREIVTRYGPLGRVDRAVVPVLHYAPGLSLTSPVIPEGQTALFVDGHLAGAVGGGKHLPHTLGDLPYRLLGRVPGRVLLLGLGPDLPRATLVVDPDRNLLDLAGVSGRAEEPRAFLGVDTKFVPESSRQPYDIVVHHVPSLHAAAETPLLTVEGLRAGLANAGEGGFAVSCALTTPPRAGLKLLATADLVTPHVVAARTADRLCVVLRRRAPTEEEKARVLAFCEENGFDPVRPAEWGFPEPFHITRTPLVAPGPDYPYDVRPATDARPYFFKFFRWSRITDLFAPGATTFVEWAYVAMIVAFLEALLLGALLMAVPVALSRAARAPALRFVALGCAFMLLEMAYLARAMVRLEGPAQAAAAVFGGFLVGAGLGSLFSARLRHAALAVAILALPGYYLMPSSALPAALLCSLVAFPMGVPFPAALSRLRPESVPWALAWNGCASVAAAAGAPLLSSSLSIPSTAGVAALLYVLISRGLRQGCGGPARLR